MDFKSFVKQYFPHDELPFVIAYNAPTDRNNLGYRCENYDNGVPLSAAGPFPKDCLNILFLGCSWVWGSGVTYEETFAKQTCDMLTQTYGVKANNWNLSMGGCGMDYVCRTLMCSVDVIKPDFVFLVVSTSDRKEYYRPDGKQLRYLQSFGWLQERGKMNEVGHEITPADAGMLKSLYGLTSQYDDFARFIFNYKLFESTLDARKIPWGMTILPTELNIEMLETLLETGWIPEHRYLGEYFTTIDHVSKTDLHPGPRSHKFFAQKLVSWIQNSCDEHLRNRVKEIQNNL